MYGYDMWVKDRSTQVYKNNDVFIELGVDNEWDNVVLPSKGNTTSWISIPKETIYVVKCERENDYCEPMKVIERKVFGERNDVNLKIAEEYFRNKIKEIL